MILATNLPSLRTKSKNTASATYNHVVTETQLEEIAIKIEDAVVEDEAIAGQLLLKVVTADHPVKTTRKRLLRHLMAVPRKMVKRDPQEDQETEIEEEVEEEEVAETLTVAKLANKIRTVELKPTKVRADPVVKIKTKLAMTAMAKTAMRTSPSSKSFLARIQMVSSEVVRLNAELRPEMVMNRDHTAAEVRDTETSHTKTEIKDHQGNSDLTTLLTTNTLKSVVVTQDVTAIIRVEVADTEVTAAPTVVNTGATEAAEVATEAIAVAMEVMPTAARDEEAGEATMARVKPIKTSDDQLFASEATC